MLSKDSDSSRSASGSKIEATAKRLREMAEQVGPDSRLPSVRELISSLEVSQSTLMAALQRLESQGVLRRRQGSGIFAAPAKPTGQFLIIIDPLLMIAPSPFWSMLLHDLTACFSAKPGEASLYFASPGPIDPNTLLASADLPQELWAGLQAGRYRGAITIGLTESLIHQIEDSGIRVTAFAGFSLSHVRLALLEACQIGVAELVALGCRRIMLYNTPYVPMQEAFMAAISMHGVEDCLLPVSEPYVDGRLENIRVTEMITPGIRAGREIARMPAAERPDGIVSLEDMFTSGFLSALNEHGLAPGRDIQVATYSNVGSPVLETWSGKLIELMFSTADIAKALAVGASRDTVPTQFNTIWERATRLESSRGPSEMLLLRPTLRRRGENPVIRRDSHG